MNPTIIAAILTGIAGPLITLAVTRYLDSRNWRRVSGPRRDLLGDWRGSMWQEYEGKMVEIPVRITFTSGMRRVRGRAEYEFLGKSVKLDFRGGFLYEHLIEFEYTNDSTLQRGTFVAELDSAGKTLDGTYAGFGLESNKPVHGTAKLTKA